MAFVGGVLASFHSKTTQTLGDTCHADGDRLHAWALLEICLCMLIATSTACQGTVRGLKSLGRECLPSQLPPSNLALSAFAVQMRISIYHPAAKCNLSRHAVFPAGSDMERMAAIPAYVISAGETRWHRTREVLSWHLGSCAWRPPSLEYHSPDFML